MLPLDPHDPPSIGPFLLRALLGENADARHYLGLAPDGAAVTVTVARPGRATDPAFRTDFTRRVTSAHELGSPYVCRVLSTDLTGTVPWAATDRPPGPTLAGLLERRGPLTPDALHTLSLVLAQALADLHGAGLAHGSPGPSDVVVTADAALLTSPASTAVGAEPADDVRAWAATVAHACGAGPEDTSAVPLQLRPLVTACLDDDPALRPSSDDLVRMLGGPRPPDPWPHTILAEVEEAAAEPVGSEDAGAEEEETGSRDAGGARNGGEDRAGGGARRLLLPAAGGAVLLLVAATAGVLFHGSTGSSGTGGAEGAAGDGSPGASAEAACSDSDGFAPAGPPPSRDGGTSSTVAFSPDGNAVAVGGPDTISVWDWREGDLIAALPWWGGVSDNLDFAPRGCVVASVVRTTRADEGYPDLVATAYDLASGTVTEHLGPQEPAAEALDPPVSDVEGLAFSPSGALLAIGLDTSEVGIVDLSTGETVGTLDSGAGSDLTFLDEDRLAAVDGEALKVWDTTTGEEVHSVRPVDGYAFTAVPGTEEVLYVRGGEVVRWDLAERAEVSSFALTDDPRGLTALPLDIIADADRGWIHVSWMDADGGAEGIRFGQVFDAGSSEHVVDPADTPFSGRLALHPEGEVIAAVVEGGGVDLVDPDTFEVTGSLF